jgi:hypothetical protein
MKICCSVCGATAYAIPPARESAILRRVQVAGEWVRFCAEHLPADVRRARRPAVSPAEALTELERLIAAENSRTEGACGAAIEHWNGDNDDAAGAVEICLEAWRGFHNELGRSLAELKKAIEESAPPQTAKPRRGPQKKIKATERRGEGQTSLIEDEATEPQR